MYKKLKAKTFPPEHRNLALQNCVLLNEKHQKFFNKHAVIHDHYVFNVIYVDNIGEDEIAFNAPTRKTLQISTAFDNEINVSRLHIEKVISTKNIEIRVDFLRRDDVNSNHISSDEIIDMLTTIDGYCVSENQVFIIETDPYYLITIAKSDYNPGIYLHNHTKVVVNPGLLLPVNLLSNKIELFKLKDFNLGELGIGGIDKQFEQLLRSVFASRLIPPETAKKMGIQHKKGVILYGPPGTGKTLLARSIGKMLDTREPKIVNGPEIFNKYVGESEENIRKLFVDAENEYKQKGDNSKLHMIIFDEIDAICKSRNSSVSGTNAGNNVVNQLLTKIDGVESLNNILVIGMTNRLDLLDSAILRPGRFGVHIELSLPDKNGREEIFRIHTSKMISNGFISEDVDICALADMTENYTGAEIESVVQTASSYTVMRQIDPSQISSGLTEWKEKIDKKDFLNALSEVKPAFGVKDDDLLISDCLVIYSDRYSDIFKQMNMYVEQLLMSKRNHSLSILIHGDIGCGKTSLSKLIATSSKFPYVKRITSEKLMTKMTDYEKINYIVEIFSDSLKSSRSIIILDDIEQLIDYVPIGPRFSNSILQCLITLISKDIHDGKLMIVGTTSSKEILDASGLTKYFTHSINLPNIDGLEVSEAISKLSPNCYFELKDIDNIPIKKLIMEIDHMNVSTNDGNN